MQGLAIPFTLRIVITHFEVRLPHFEDQIHSPWGTGSLTLRFRRSHFEDRDHSL
jgi:hypothetical protein